MMTSIQTWIMYGCFAALAALAVVLFFGVVFPLCWEKLRQLVSLPKIELVLVVACAVGLIQYGATKGRVPVVNYDGGIKTQNRNDITNNTVKIYWQRDVSEGVYVPTNAPVYIDYRYYTNTNGTWTSLAETYVGAWQWIGTVTDATNYDYKVWAYYIPPEPVHTNGVWQYKTLKDRYEEYAIPLRARIEVNGRAIATPKEKRKDEEE